MDGNAWKVEGEVFIRFGFLNRLPVFLQNSTVNCRKQALLLCLSVLILLPCSLTAQQMPVAASDTLSVAEKPCKPLGLGAVLFPRNKKNPVPQEKAAKNYSLLVLPNVSSNPANGLLIGVGGSAGWWFGPRENTNVSSAGFTLAYTTKKQFLLFAKHNAYTPRNKLFLQGDWRFYIYSQPTYGLGTNAPEGIDLDPSWNWQAAPTEDLEGAYPMKFNYFKFHEIISTKVVNNLYVGGGLHVDLYRKIQDELLDLEASPQLFTPHFGYSGILGFDNQQYAVSGLSVNAVYDSRDNLINPYSGIYANLNIRQNFRWMGSDQPSTFLFFDIRGYKSLSKRHPRHVIAGWLWGNLKLAGEAPYLALQSLGDDQRARSGRGYIQGRYRGESLLNAEIEYRFPISRCTEILGGVVFVNATTASSELSDVKLFQYIQPAIGAGLRIMINPDTRMNICLDYGKGRKSGGFYFGGGEVF
jgi:hypothetical protein